MAPEEHRNKDAIEERQETRPPSNELSHQQRLRMTWVYLVMAGVIVTLAIMLAIATGVLGNP